MQVEKKQFAVSDCVYVPGLIFLNSNGEFTFDPNLKRQGQKQP